VDWPVYRSSCCFYSGRGRGGQRQPPDLDGRAFLFRDPLRCACPPPDSD
jgi:hypothetical protein